MKIGIDISQLAFTNTGVANYLLHLTSKMIENSENEYILFYSSLRKSLPNEVKMLTKYKNVTVKKFKLPPTALHILFNIIHLTPIEKLIGPVDVFITSDWTEPPVRNAKKMTIIYDMVVYKYPQETAKKIVSVQKKKLSWVKRETEMVLCISESTKKDAIEILGIDPSKIQVIYPGF